jgi:hypothetical protein
MLVLYPYRIPDPGVKKAPDPGSGSATLVFTVDAQDAVTHMFLEVGECVYLQMAAPSSLISSLGSSFTEESGVSGGS